MSVVVGLTQGDVNGVGAKMILKLLGDESVLEHFTPLIYGSSKVMAYYRKAVEMPNFSFHVVPDASKAVRGKVNLLEVTSGEAHVDGNPGSALSGKWAAMELRQALNDARAGVIAGVVSAPVSNAPYDDEDASCSDELLNERSTPALMTFRRLRVAAMSRKTDSLTHEDIVTAVRRTVDLLRSDFGVDRPRVAVLSLKRSDENVESANEITDVVIPAIKRLCDENILCFGPIDSPRFFDEGDYRHYDIALALDDVCLDKPFLSVAGDAAVRLIRLDDVIWASSVAKVGYGSTDVNDVVVEGLRNAVYSVLDIARQRAISADERMVSPLQG